MPSRTNQAVARRHGRPAIEAGRIVSALSITPVYEGAFTCKEVVTQRSRCRGMKHFHPGLGLFREPAPVDDPVRWLVGRAPQLEKDGERLADEHGASRIERMLIYK